MAAIKVGDTVVRVDGGKILKFPCKSDWLPRKLLCKPIHGKVVAIERKGGTTRYRVRLASDEPGDRPSSYLSSELKKKGR